MPKASADEVIRRLRKLDTPTVANVVATYPGMDLCLKIYDPWEEDWYTNQTVHCMFPEWGVRIGYAATAVYSEKSEDYPKVGQWDLPEHLDKTKKPIVLVAKQEYPSKLFNKAGLFGGNMTSLYDAFGVEAVITNGAIRDLDEIREIGVQYYASGVTPGHGPVMLRAVNVPVTVAGMVVTPGDFLHMDKHGAVKFPASRMREVLVNGLKLRQREADYRKIFAEPNFSLKKLKAKKIKGY